MTSNTTSAPIALITGGSRGLGRSMAEHLAARGVGVVITYRSAEGKAREVVSAAQAASQTPLGRVGEADDIGAAVELLLSPGAHWINGQRIEASGGMRA